MVGKSLAEELLLKVPIEDLSSEDISELFSERKFAQISYLLSGDNN